MTQKFFVDSDFLTGLFAVGDSRHESAQNIFDYLLEKELISEFQDFHLSNYIIMEVLHNLKGKNIPLNQINDKYQTLKQCNVFHIKIKEIDQAFREKLLPFCNHRTQNPPIGIVDATSLVVMDKKRIGSIISFDEHFDILPDLFIRITNKEVIDQRILSFCR